MEQCHTITGYYFQYVLVPLNKIDMKYEEIIIKMRKTGTDMNKLRIHIIQF